MHTKNIVLKTALVFAITGLIFTGCKKDESDAAASADEINQQLTSGADESRFSSTSDAALDESNDVSLDNSRFRGPGFTGTWLSWHTPCNATVDSSQANIGKITITFNGNSCDGMRS